MRRSTGLRTLMAVVLFMMLEPFAANAAPLQNLVGTFEITSGQCSDSGVTGGSSFRMIQKGGTAKSGPFVPNADSPCGDDTYTPLSAGRDGGLSTGRYQPNPKPAFDGTGNGLAAAIHKPQSFYHVNFACSTNATDPQSGKAAPKPRIGYDPTGKLTGEVTAFSCAWNGQYFNQGAPKPGGGTPGLTSTPRGMYSLADHSYKLNWRSAIVGGPFDGFTGVWHLEGTFLTAPTVTFQVGGHAKGQPVSMQGKVSPTTSAEKVTLRTEHRKGGKWVALDKKSARSDITGSFSFTHPAVPVGTYRSRAEVGKTADHAAGVSPWRKFTVGAASVAPAALSASASGSRLRGTFRLAAGVCGSSSGIKGGSFFRMTQPGGTPKNGPYVENGDSPCKDKTVTPLRPGSQGGLSTTHYQPNPKPAFDSGGNGRAKRIHRPQPWFGVRFACSTNHTDPQSKDTAPIPRIVNNGGHLSGNTSAFSCAWNKQFFNVGAPKPDGSTPGHTTALRGTYNSSTHRFVMQWSSQIVGGPFDKFTATWHLVGTFDAA
jgi:hypothetical protein